MDTVWSVVKKNHEKKTFVVAEYLMWRAMSRFLCDAVSDQEWYEFRFGNMSELLISN